MDFVPFRWAIGTLNRISSETAGKFGPNYVTADLY